ncbi:MAG: T9SS type A sorting domain-containing protein [Saprospiraceae bacterium]|nr:MAG: T9SS type A sorting domain-containing protein [Saprospiraceae bacterium]
MKNFFTILLVAFLSYFGTFVTSATAQSVVAEGGCTDVTVVSGFPYYWNNLYEFVAYTGTCSAVTSYPANTMKNKMYLDSLNHGTDAWETAAGPQYPPNNTFSNLRHGTYRVRILSPIAVTSTSCANGYISVYSYLGQFLGYVGNYDYGGETGTFYSNQVVVGNTTPADISYSFIDIPETGSELTYDYGEIVKINAETCINYNYWWAAIFEDGPTYHRYKSNGWTHGTVPNNEFNLSNLWNTWNFETYHSYTVQFVVENNECKNSQYWNNLDRTFFICPAGSGCRFGIDEREIIVSPNPASSTILLQNFEPDLDRDYRMVFADLMGKVVKRVSLTSSEVDISDLQNGMFVVTVQREGKQIFTSKLVVDQ